MPTTKPESVPPGSLYRFSVEEYDRMVAAGVFDDMARVELLEGWIVRMSPQDPRHAGTVTLVQEAIEARLPGEWFVRLQAPVATRSSRPEPDLAVVRRSAHRYLSRHPAAADIGLLVEVSNESLRKDRSVKRRIYGRARIPAYWIVNVRDGQVEVREGRGWRILRPGDAVPLVLRGEDLGEIPVAGLLPPG